VKGEQIMQGKRLAAYLTSAILMIMPLSGCSGSGKEDSKQTGPNIVISAPLVDDAEAETFKQQINEALPDMGIEVTTVSIGDTEKDPASAMAGIMKVTTIFAGKEADVFISDYESAQRNAGQEIFYPLTDLFTEEELEPFQDKIISFEMTNTDGNPTGETFENCGIDVSDREDLAKLCAGSDTVGVYIVSNSTNLDAAKEIFRQIVFESVQ